MKLWDLIIIILIGLAALIYLIIYIKKELSARKTACMEEENKSCGSFCNACGKKQCSMESASTCKILNNDIKRDKKKSI